MCKNINARGTWSIIGGKEYNKILSQKKKQLEVWGRPPNLAS